MVKKTMKKNVFCYLSEVGHNNFYYATNTKVIIKENTSYEIMPWISSNRGLQAIKVKNKNILHLSNPHYTESSGESILWIEKDKLPLSSVG